MKNRFSTLLLLFIFLLGACILFYPAFSDYWNSRVQTRAIMDYEAAMANMTQEDYTAYFDMADIYNKAVAELPFPLVNYPQLDEMPGVTPYMDNLNLRGDGIMGYINIDLIEVELPIYHGTSTAVLNVAVGHLEGTSLPAGGESTHCVLSTHRGLPSAKLFSELDKLRIGDVFTLTVLNRVLTYEVENISIVLPNQVDSLYVQPGRDLCTLFTCTPYGINSHRLLVTGHRIETDAPKSTLYVPADGFIVDPLIIAPILGVIILMGVLIVLMVRTRRRPEA